MRYLILMVVCATCFCESQVSVAQHCAPIVESYLSGTNLKRNKAGIEFDFRYSKTGGKRKAAYQAYVVAFAESDREKVSNLTPQKAIEEGLATVVHTQVAESDEFGQYEFKYELKTKVFVEAMLKSKRIAEDRISDIGGWKRYSDDLRLAVFIPFLDDKEYSVLKGLPDDKHECNYRSDSALLFETISQKLEVCFGTVQATRLADGDYYIQVNGNRPAAKK